MKLRLLPAKALEFDSIDLRRVARHLLDRSGLVGKRSFDHPVPNRTRLYPTRPMNGLTRDASSLLFLYHALPLVRRSKTVLLDLIQ
jgi:hypothetical protein